MRHHQPQTVTILYTADPTEGNLVQRPEQTYVVAVNGVRQKSTGENQKGIPDVIAFVNVIYAANGYTSVLDDSLVDRNKRLWCITLEHPGDQNQPCEYMWVHYTKNDGVTHVNRTRHTRSGEDFAAFCNRHADWNVVYTLEGKVKGKTCSILRRFLPALNPEEIQAICQKSTLTEEQAALLVEEIDQNVGQMLREERLLVELAGTCAASHRR